MNDLLEKLEAKIAETERIAIRAAQAHKGASAWTFARGNEDVEPAVFIGERSLYSDWHGVDYLMPSEVEHIAHNDPSRVLRRVARDRKLLARHKPVDAGYGNLRCYQCREDHTEFGEYDNVSQPVWWPCDDVRDLAEDYEIEMES